MSVCPLGGAIATVGALLHWSADAEEFLGGVCTATCCGEIQTVPLTPLFSPSMPQHKASWEMGGFINHLMRSSGICLRGELDSAEVLEAEKRE